MTYSPVKSPINWAWAGALLIGGVSQTLLWRWGPGLGGLADVTGSLGSSPAMTCRTAAVSAGNGRFSRYKNPAYDALVASYVAAIDPTAQERGSISSAAPR